MEIVGIDSLGRKHIVIDGVSLTLIKIIPFEQWVENRSGGMAKFGDLSKRDKEKIFLRWKWLFTDDRVNEELEANEKHILHLFKDSDLSELSEAWKYYIQKKRDFDKLCYETKKRMGLIIKETPSDPFVNKVMEAFDGTMV